MSPTRPGNPIIRRCSTCAMLILQPTLDSFNTCGARYWTDGKRDIPALRHCLLLAKCWHCGALSFIDELEEEEVEPPLPEFLQSRLSVQESVKKRPAVDRETAKQARYYAAPTLQD